MVKFKISRDDNIQENQEAKNLTKILIVFHSRSGNTERMAMAIAEGAKRVKGTIVEVKQANKTTIEDLQIADGIIMGSPTYYGMMSSKLKDLIDKSVRIHGKLAGKVGAAFTSSGGTASGAETTLLSILQAMLVHGMIIQGRHEDKHYGATAVGAPNIEEDTASCRELGKRVAKLAARLKV